MATEQCSDVHGATYWEEHDRGCMRMNVELRCERLKDHDGPHRCHLPPIADAAAGRPYLWPQRTRAETETTRYVFLLKWHIAGYMMRRTLCGKEIQGPVYCSTSTGDEKVCARCAEAKAAMETKGAQERR